MDVNKMAKLDNGITENDKDTGITENDKVRQWNYNKWQS